MLVADIVVVIVVLGVVKVVWDIVADCVDV